MSGVDLREAGKGAELDDARVLGTDSGESVKSLSNETLLEEPQSGHDDSGELRDESSDLEQVQPTRTQPLPAPSGQGDQDYKDEGPVEYYQLEEFKPE